MDLQTLKMKDIEILYKNTSIEALPALLEFFKRDTRAGVQKLYQKGLKELQALENLKIEWQQKQDFDECFRESGQVLVGVDEVGRGPLAGPVVACAVVLPTNCELLGVKDSKKLTEEKRELLYNEIMKKALYVGIGIIEATEIDEINILQATFKAMRVALEKMNVIYQTVLVDGDKTIPQLDCIQHAIVKGDNKSASIAAASIVAKVTRDRMMKEYALTYPMYDWESNKGYGSTKHYEGIRHYGITSLHRKTFLKKEGF